MAEHQHLDNNHDTDEALHKIKTAGSISISPELFEKIYLSPQNQVKGELRKTFANPTPVAIGGFLLALTPLTCDLMNWRDAQLENGASDIGAYFFFGCLLMVVAGFLEFVVGNTFPMCVFTTFGAFWGTFGATLQPFYHSYLLYPKSIEDPHFLNAFGFFLLWMGVLCLAYLICALRTNMVFVLIFFCLIPAFSFLTAAFWYAAMGDTDTYSTYLKVGGVFVFIVCCLGWWIFMAILLAALDFPFQLPVGDMSQIVKGASEKV